MTYHWHTLRKFSTKHFDVVLQCEQEECPELSWADAETLDKLERGIWKNYVFRVVVRFNGAEVGADYLGNSIYENPADFAREHYGMATKGRADGCVYCCYFPDMVRQAIREARHTLSDMPRLRDVP